MNRETVMIDMKGGTDSMEENIEKWNAIESPSIEEIQSYGDSNYVSSFYYTYQIGMDSDDLTPATDTIQKTETDTTTTKFEGGGNRPGAPGGSSTTTTTHHEKISTFSTNGDFTLVGYSTLEGMSEFVSGNYTISQGEIDTNFETNSCVISQELATLNEISVGDTITLVSTNDEDKTYELTVPGIYEDNEENSNTMDKMYSDSANKIITNATVVQNIINDDDELKPTITPTYILKSKDVVEPRMIAIYLISEILEIPLVSIGKIFGGRDHTTIMHSRDKISDQLKTSHKIQSFVSEIKKMLTSG